MSLVQISTDPLIDLWLADLSNETWPSDSGCLSEIERQRAARFQFERDRRRYIVAHLLLRRMLSDKLGGAPQEICFEPTAAGKPYASSSAGIFFNISYAENFALFGFSCHSDIGVDLERLRTIEDAQELAELHFTASERRVLATRPVGRGRDRAFLRGWTRKEACVKAVGAGLALPTSEFDSGLEKAPRQLCVTINRTAVPIEVHSFEVGETLIGAWSRLL